VLDPLVNVAMNRDWNGRPIFRPEMNPRQPTPGFERARDTSSVVARGLSKFFDAITGGKEGVPGKYSPTPDEIDYLMGYATGAAGRELVIKPMQYIDAKRKGEELPAYKTPLVGGFSVHTKDKGGQATKYYEATAKVLKAETVRDDRKKKGKSLEGFATEFPEIRLLQRMKDTEQKIAELKQQRSKLKERGAGPELIKLRTDKINTIMSQFNEKYRTLRQAELERQNKAAEL
jgi:hypothetical protein